MAEFKFLATPDESLGILNAILGSGLAWGAEMDPVKTPQIDWIKTPTDDLAEVVERRRALMFWLPGISIQPVEFKLAEDGPFAGKYFVQWVATGPLIFWDTPKYFVRNDALYLNFGSLHHDPKFYDWSSKQYVPHTPEFRARYNDLVGMVKDRCKTFGLKKIWAAPEARKLLESGAASLYVGSYGKKK